MQHRNLKYSECKGLPILGLRLLGVTCPLFDTSPSIIRYIQKWVRKCSWQFIPELSYNPILLSPGLKS